MMRGGRICRFSTFLTSQVEYATYTRRPNGSWHDTPEAGGMVWVEDNGQQRLEHFDVARNRAF